MTKEEKLYEVLGELLYAIAKADGVIQNEEKEALTNLLKNHPNSSGILWSFEYEESKETSIDEIYQKVINYCHGYGPSPIYNEFIEAMNVLAEASDGVHVKETEIIESFSKDLLDRFRKDAERLKNESS
jgi:hypothetical protein